MLNLDSAKILLKTSDNKFAIALLPILKRIVTLNLPLPLIPYKVIGPIYTLLRYLCIEITRIFWWTPLFKCYLRQAPGNLYLYTGMPYIVGNLAISIGEDCRISGQTTLSGRNGAQKAELKIGNNVGISWQTTIAVGTKIDIGNNVRIAGRGFLAGYPGHPVNPIYRAKGLPDTEDQIGDIILEDNVWLGTNCTILANVRIGENSIIGTGSIVTKNIPANVIAAGNPAKVIRTLTPQELAGI